MRGQHLDPTRLSRSGEYVADSDEHARVIPPGSSKDHRPELTQAVLELRGSPEGGVPFMSQRGGPPSIGNVPGELRPCRVPSSLPLATVCGADAKLDPATTPPPSTRWLYNAPSKRSVGLPGITARERGPWPRVVNNRYKRVSEARRMAPRWLVVVFTSRRDRAAARSPSPTSEYVPLRSNASRASPTRETPEGPLTPRAARAKGWR